MSRDHDINVHVKADGTEPVKQQLESVAQGAKETGRTLETAHEQGGQAAQKHSSKLGSLGSLLESISKQATAFVTGMLSFSLLNKVWDTLIAKAERYKQIQAEIYQQSVTLEDVGQALEVQTGTVGEQKRWAKTAVEVQKAGGLANAGVAQDMLIAADIAFGAQGGIKNTSVVDIVKQLSPLFASSRMGAEQVSKFFEMAGIAGVDPTADAYKEFFAKLRTGSTVSKATQFGDFLIGIQKGATGYLSEGGSLEKAISTFTGARAVTANESLAATLFEQIGRIASGGYEGPREAIVGMKMPLKQFTDRQLKTRSGKQAKTAQDKAVDEAWSKMTPDQRLEGLFDWVKSIPAPSRTQKLIEAGVPIEVASGLGKMVSEEATRTMAATDTALRTTTPEQVTRQAQAYLESDTGKSRITQAEFSEGVLKAAPHTANWQQRLEKSQADFKLLQQQGKDRFLVADSAEPTLMAAEDLIKDLEPVISGSDKSAAQKARLVRHMLNMSASQLRSPLSLDRTLGERQLPDLASQAMTIINNYDNGITYNAPFTRDERSGVRSDPNAF
jgi:hypothetical protein